jgi:nitroreductase
MQALELLKTRSSTSSKLLQAPGPNQAELEQLLTLAMRVPDHGKLMPWRLIVIQGEAREALSKALVDRFLHLKPDADEASIAKEHGRFLHAPVIVAIVACITPNHKIPESEQYASASAVCMQLLNAAHAQGFGAQWLTAWAAYDDVIKARLGLIANEHIAGFVHLGNGAVGAERVRPALVDKVSQFA